MAQGKTCSGRDNDGDVCRRDQVVRLPTPADVAVTDTASPSPSVFMRALLNLSRDMIGALR